MSNFIKIVVAIVILAFLLVIGPWLVIWAMNTLLPALAIEFNLATWAAVIIMGSFFRANVKVNR